MGRPTRSLGRARRMSAPTAPQSCSPDGWLVGRSARLSQSASFAKKGGRERMTNMPMVDAHVHFWDPTRNYYPWLNDRPLIPFRYGDYSAICRPYLPDDYKRDATTQHNVVKTVYIEAEWDPKDPIGEMEYIARLRRETGWPNVAVGQAWLDSADRAEVLERLAAFDFVRGVRHKPRSNPKPNMAATGSMVDPHWVEGYALLARHGLRFDLQTPWWHLQEAAQLADRYPNIPM